MSHTVKRHSPASRNFVSARLWATGLWAGLARCPSLGRVCSSETPYANGSQWPTACQLNLQLGKCGSSDHGGLSRLDAFGRMSAFIPLIGQKIYFWTWHRSKIHLYFLYWVSTGLVALPIVLAPTRILLDLRWSSWPLCLSEVDNESGALRTPFITRGPRCSQHRHGGTHYSLMLDT